MAQLGELLNLQAQMFLLILAGVILRKANVIPETSKKILTDVLLYFILPCNIINSFRMEFHLDILKTFALMLVVAILIQVVSFTLSRTLYNHKPDATKKVLQYVTIVSNSGFLGLPIIDGIFGAEGMMYASLFIVPMRIMMWTAGISCFTGESDKKAAIKKVIVHPCIVAVYIGLFLMFTQLELPVFLDKTIRGASGCTTTVSMLVIGVILSEVDLKTLMNWNVFETIIVRLLVLPLCALAICKVMRLDAFFTGIAVILTAMPAGSTSAMLAAKYNGDYKFATKCVVCTTIASLLTIPVWCMVIGG